MKAKHSLKLSLKGLAALGSKTPNLLRLVNKRPQFGHHRSKALNATPRTWKQNFQRCQVFAHGKKLTVFLPVRLCKTLKSATKDS